MKKMNLKLAAFAAALALLPVGKANAQAFTENFDDINTLAGGGWVLTNNSAPVGVMTNWFQGTSAGGGGPFDSYNGAANSYIAGNFNFTSGGSGIINGWLMTPNRTFRNGDVLTFYTRKPAPSGGLDYPDRMEVRLSTNGASTNTGPAGNNTGDFSNLLLSINPTLVAGGYPSVWTQYTITISGLPAPTSGRIAFRYFVTGAGPSGVNSDYIGIDNVVYAPYVCPAFTMTASGALAGATTGSAYSTTLTQTGSLGAPNFAVTAGALPPGLTLSTSGTISGTPVATGTFNFTVTVNDASGCSGSQSYSITVVCGANPVTFSAVPVLCSNGAEYALTATPAGGTFSGTGVSGGNFDPSAGTQTLTYSYTDAYGCAYTSDVTATVNTAPVVTQSSPDAVCADAENIVLTGGSPAGGAYSGTGVSAGEFDPGSGTQTVTYSYTDANGCSSSAEAVVTVLELPEVTQETFDEVCSNNGPVTLNGGLPEGGSYSGTGVTANIFDPASGTQEITYTFEDEDGCSASASQTITVLAAPEVTQEIFDEVCSNNGPVTLGGGLPEGGSYSGTGVTANIFDPASGTQEITYTFEDENGCSASASQTITVLAAPEVSLSLTNDAFCNYNSPAALGGGMPAGGVYAGTGVTGDNFNPGTAGNGSHTITYTYTDENGCTDNATDLITVGDCLSVGEIATENVVVYPNPSAGMFTVKGLTGTAQVTDLNGKVVAASVISSNGELLVDLSEMTPGIYLLASGTKVLRLQKL